MCTSRSLIWFIFFCEQDDVVVSPQTHQDVSVLQGQPVQGTSPRRQKPPKVEAPVQQRATTKKTQQLPSKPSTKKTKTNTKHFSPHKTTPNSSHNASAASSADIRKGSHYQQKKLPKSPHNKSWKKDGSGKVDKENSERNVSKVKKRESWESRSEVRKDKKLSSLAKVNEPSDNNESDAKAGPSGIGKQFVTLRAESCTLHSSNNTKGSTAQQQFAVNDANDDSHAVGTIEIHQIAD